MRRLTALAYCVLLGASQGCKTTGQVASPPGAAGGSPSGGPYVRPSADAAGAIDSKPCEPGEGVMLDVALAPQEQSTWCWAASGQMIMTFFGKPVDQCTQVSRVAGACACAKTCTSDDAIGGCNNGGWPDFDGFGFDSRATITLDEDNTLDPTDPKRALTLAQLKEQLYCKRSPVAFAWKKGRSTGHMLVLYGYSGDELLARDPDEPCVGADQILDYDGYLRDNTARFSHWRDQFEVKVRL